MTYEMDTLQRPNKGSLRLCIVKNTVESTHNASETLDTSLQVLQHDQDVANSDGAAYSGRDIEQ